jgi:hypothetical protein
VSDRGARLAESCPFCRALSAGCVAKASRYAAASLLGCWTRRVCGEAEAGDMRAPSLVIGKSVDQRAPDADGFEDLWAVSNHKPRGLR